MKTPIITCISFLRRKTSKELLAEFFEYFMVCVFYTVAASFTMWAVLHTIAEYGFNGFK